MYNIEQPIPNFKINEVHVNSYLDFKQKLISNTDDKNTYYRGESNSEWSLNSSMVRKFLYANKKAFTLDKGALDSQVNEYKVEYERKISSNHGYIRFLFYLQHSISFSPFIDLTENLWIALSFSLSNHQKYSDSSIKNDAAIYAFKVKNKDSRILNTQGRVNNILENLSIGINKTHHNEKNVEAYIIDIKDLRVLNDRMQYQKGAFLLLNNYSIDTMHNSRQEYDEEELDITKYVICKMALKDLFWELRENHKPYTINYLEDPYLFLKNIQ